MSGRLNGVIRALENGGPAVTAFSRVDVNSALAFADAPYDGVIFETEHDPWDGQALRDCLQYMLSRKQILDQASPAPKVTPLTRVPANGGEMNQWFAKQALDLGFYGVIWPHVSTVAEAYNAVAACRYPRLRGKPLYEPAGVRGDGPAAAMRYWGVSQQDYYRKADVWPLAPDGEILVVVMIEDTAGIANLRDMLKEVPGIGAILIGEGDLSQELGIPRQYDHPELRSAMAEIVAISKEAGVPVGHPHVGTDNAERVLAEGFRFLIAAPERRFGAVEMVRGLARKG